MVKINYHPEKRYSIPTRIITVFLSAITIVLLSRCGSGEYTRGIGVYPGDPSEDFSPVMYKDSTVYRNLAFHRPSYNSSSFDYNLTAELVTDGIRASNMPYRISCASSQEGTLPRNEREWLIDHNYFTGISLDSTYGWVQIALLGDSLPSFDRIDIGAIVRVDLKSPGRWSYRLLGSNDNSNWTELGGKEGYGYPGDTMQRFFRRPGPNPFRRLTASIEVKSPEKYQYFRLLLQSRNVMTWRFSGFDFYKDDKEVEVMPSARFTSAWMSAGTGKEWVMVDLGSVCSISQVDLYWIKRALEGSVQVSNDEQNWKDISNWTNGSGEKDEFKYSTPEAGRYVRVLMTKPESQDGYVMSEMEVYGRGGFLLKPKDQPDPEDKYHMQLAGGAWKVQRASLVHAEGNTLSKEGYNDSTWVSATVPGTVLVSYRNAGALPNPNYSDNQLMISDSFFNSDFWYRDNFDIPSSFNDKHLFLNFDGINWKAEVYFNGHDLGRIEGAFKHARFDIIQYVNPGAKNYLAVRIIKNAHYGNVKEQTAESTDKNGGILGADNPTMHATIGWDWIPTIRGRDMGIWNNVYLTHSGPVTIDNPYVKSELPLPDTTSANLHFVFTLTNHNNTPVEGTIHATLGNISFFEDETLESSETKVIEIDPDQISDLKMKDPELWWPNGYGSPHLYDVRIEFKDNSTGDVSDVNTFKTGIREMTYRMDSGALKIWINGRRFVGRGGNWGFPESNLAYRDREYDVAVRLHRGENFTMIRNWVGQTGDDGFYKACDKYGIMIWQDFWLANPADGPDPDDNRMFMDNAVDFIKRIRHHPSLALYCGRNEGDPPQPIDSALRAEIKVLDPGMEYISNSADKGVSGHGPYRAMPVKFYFENRATPELHSEIGMPNVVTYESLKKMMPDSSLWPAQGRMWGIHDFCLQSAQSASSFIDMINNEYGGADNIKDWDNLAQFVNYQGYRAIFEAQSKHRMGALLWMSHPAWPSMVWQTYDYYFSPTAGYFGCKKGSEPLHIQWNMLTDSIEVVNYSVEGGMKLKAYAELYNMDGTLKWHKETTVNCPEDNTAECFKMEYPEGLSDVQFIRLKLMQGDRLISDNFYWRGKEEYNYKALKEMPKVKIDAKTSTSKSGGQWRLTTVLNNSSKSPVIMVRLKVVRSNTGDRILPAYYSDNYISLMPGESKTIQTMVENADTRAEKPKVVISGFNLQP